MEHHDDIARAIEVGWLWLIPFFPLLGAALNVFLGPRLQEFELQLVLPGGG